MKKIPVIRRCFAAVVFLLFAISFLQAAPAGSPFYWVERAQLVPALLSSINGQTWAWIALGSLLVLTLLFGRVYCSWICPLGILQDLMHRLAHPNPQKRKGAAVRYGTNHRIIRATVAFISFGALIVGSSFVLTWLDPYSISARLMVAVVNPAVQSAGNWLGVAETPADWLRYAPWLFIVVIALAAVPLTLAFLRGRLYCNTLCPVGALLGLLSLRAPFVPGIQSSRCVKCGSCLRACKANAINLKTMQVDASRCVACYDCVGVCSSRAMTLTAHPAPVVKPVETAAVPAVHRDTDLSRRAFLGLGVSGLAAAVLPELKTEPSVDPTVVGTNEGPATVPPGSGSLDHLLDTCTGCGLCISACPTHVLRPSYLALGWKGLMKPYLDYTAGFCDPTCNACSQVCPVGALNPLSLAQKRSTQIGLSAYRQQHCIIWQRRESCVRCAKVCPTGALTTVEIRRPQVNPDACKGCRGKHCYNACPTGSVDFVTREDNGRRLAFINYATCIGCGYCAEACTKHHGIDLEPFLIPQLNPALCNGCGACQHVCPPEEKAMYVHPRHTHLSLAEDAATPVRNEH